MRVVSVRLLERGSSMAPCRHPVEGWVGQMGGGLGDVRLVEGNPHQHLVFFGKLDGRDVVLKCFDSMTGASSEWFAMGVMASGGVPVAQPVGIYSVECGECRVYLAVLIMTRIQGTSAAECVVEWKSDRDIWGDVADALRRQFRILSVACGGDYVMQRWANFEQRYAKLLVSRYGVDREVFTRMELQARELPSPGCLVPITFDWRLRHIWVQNRQMVGLLDLEYLAAGDARLEVANLIHDAAMCMGAEYAAAVQAYLLRDLFQGEAADVEHVIRWCRARQAFSHAAIRSLAGDSCDQEIEKEIWLGVECIV